jgi:H+/Cl- antiporter ClcA
MPEAEAAPDPTAIMRDRRFLFVLALAAGVGVVAAGAAWGLLELLHELQPWVFDDLPDALGFDGAPTWWPLPVLAFAGVITAAAIVRLPGTGGHVPAHGLDATPTKPTALPGVIAAATASIGLGLVLGPEAPLIALGGGLGFLAVGLIRRDAPDDVATLVAVSGTFSAVSFLFGSPVIAAVLLIEAAGIGGPRLPLVLIPGLLAAGIGSLVSIGLGSWTGVDTSDIAFDALTLPEFPRPELVDFLWTIPLAAVIALGVFAIFFVGRRVVPLANTRPFVVLPVVGLAVAALAILFELTTDKGPDHVLFSGQETLGPLVANSATWSTGALLAVIACKGIAYGLSLGSFRGGPVFPALFLGGAVGVLFAELPGFDLTPAVAVALGAATVAVLRLPLSAVVLAVLLTSGAGAGVAPLIIVGVVVAYLVTLALPMPADAREPAPTSPRSSSPGGAPSR